MAKTPLLDLQDIQALVLFGHGQLPHAAFLNLRFGAPAAAKAWLRGIAVTHAGPRDGAARQRPAVQLAFTATGLAVLGLDAAALATFAQEFREGMDADERTRLLGDTAENAPAGWEFGQGDGVHALLMLYAADAAALAAVLAGHQADLAAHGIGVPGGVQGSRPQPFSKEHFGFRDGLSQPAIAGAPGRVTPGETPIPAGEFVLGYADSYGHVPFSPRVPLAADPQRLLPPTAPDAGSAPGADLGRNGTYLVFRKLEQDVALFWRFMAAHAGGGGPRERRQAMIALAAKMVGRWPDGTPLVRSPERPEPAGGAGRARNDFAYHAQDPDGLRCPVAAHIRRANPRDSLAPDPQASLAMVRAHRLMRRGRSYGDPLRDRLSGTGDGQRRGLYFIALNASLRRQFEFVQQTWINNPKFDRLSESADPITAGRDAPPYPSNTMHIPADPVRRRVPGVPQFVTTRGGGYFFMPGLRALRWLAGLP